MIRGSSLLTAAIVASPTPWASDQFEIHPDERVVIEFGFEESPHSKIGPIDFISFMAGWSVSGFSEQSFIIVRFYDEYRILANLQKGDMWTSFKTFDSLWRDGNVIDMTPVQDGSILGRYEIDVVFHKSLEAPFISTSLPWIITGTATSSNSWWPGPDGVVLGCWKMVAPFADSFEAAPARRPCNS